MIKDKDTINGDCNVNVNSMDKYNVNDNGNDDYARNDNKGQ